MWCIFRLMNWSCWNTDYLILSYLTEFSSLSFLSPVPYLSWSFKRPDVPRLPRMELVANGTRFSQTEKKTLWVRHILTRAKTFHCGVFTAVDRDRITSRLIYDNKIFCITLFSCSLTHFSVKLAKLVLRYSNAPWKSLLASLTSSSGFLVLKQCS